MKITEAQLQKLSDLLKQGKEHAFYTWKPWQRKRREVLALDNYECQSCKARGKYRRGEIVHHIKRLKDRPDLAMSVYDPETGERQLVAVCKACHEEDHADEFVRPAERAEPLTQERWD